MDKSLVGLVVLVDEQFLPIFGELRATDSIAMVLKRYAFKLRHICEGTKISMMHELLFG